MKKPWLRKTARIVGIVLLVFVLVVSIVPLIVQVPPLEGLALSNALTGPDSQFVTIPWQGTDGLDIHYVSDDLAVDGGPVFVLLHGSMLNAYTWDRVVPWFADRGRVVAYDQLPYGLSEKLTKGEWNGPNPYTPAAAVTQLIGLMDALEIEQAVLVGSSYGGKLALLAAAEYPDRVQALVLVDAAVYVEEEMPAWAMELPQVQRLGPLLARALGTNEPFYRQMYANPDALDAARLERSMTHAQVEDWDLAMWEYLSAWGTDAPDVTRAIALAQQPSLVISGDSDTIVPVADSKRLADELANAELVILGDCGHLPQEECPQNFQDVLASWLEERSW